MQGINRDAEIENGLVNTVGEVNVGGIEKVALIYIYTALCKTDSGKLLYNTGSSAQCSVTARRMGLRGCEESSREKA